MNQKEIAAALQSMGLKKGDKVLLHSSLVSLGTVEGGPDAVIDAFVDVIGKEGTLLVPVFTALGVITDTLKKRPGAVISPCPVGTLAAIGADSETLCRDHWKAETAHGKDTPFTRLADMNGYVCLLGVDQDRNTTLHGVESLLELPYLNNTTQTFMTPDGETVTKTWKYYPGPHRDFIGLDRYFREAGALKITRIGNAQVRLIKAKDLFEIGLQLGSKDPAFVLCDNPACADCVRQRAAIFADRMEKESFRLTASSRLAGRYLPEMIENLKEVGIRFIELDYLQGKACAVLPPEKLKAAVDELQENGITVSGLRVEVVPDESAKLIEKAVAAGIKRLIVPLGDAAAVAACADGVEIVAYNHIHTAKKAAAALKELDQKINGFCFNPPAFVKAGEMPFLQSYKIGRFIRKNRQLDIADSRRDGVVTRLAQGNGEIKELISILRCHNFSGWFTLGGGVIYPGTLKEAAKDFVHLLDNM
ncbi:MAG: AAC(3) family N-acetyltransferase [Lentisphaeria bacterium]|nr:AAC(3) family N-acetyltransferase [Lentisphaeria bacterium]MBR4884290.1 AAC(3) family N-acetyltransferase [Lentisphaeria bacterium]